MTPPWQLSRDMFLSFEEVDALLAHLRKRHQTTAGRSALAAQLDRVIVEGLLFSGLRTSEFCRLRLADTVIGHGRSVFVVTGLGGRDRTVHVPSRISDLVEAFVAKARRHLLPEDVDPDDPAQPLLFGERRSPLKRTGLYRRVVRVLTGVGLGDRASVQLLRHTYGYLAYARSHGNLLFVQKQLGHAHPMVTVIYSQFVEESYESLAEQVDSPHKREVPDHGDD